MVWLVAILVCTVVINVWTLVEVIVSILRHDGVTIRVIQEEAYAKTPTPQESTLSKEEQELIDKYNTEQSEFLSSIQNLQRIFVDEDQMMPGDKQ